MKTNDLREFITAELKKLCEDTYCEKKKKSVYRYIIFSYQKLFIDCGRNCFQLYIDVVDRNRYAAEELADSIEKNFLGLSYDNDILSLYITDDAKRSTIIEEDKSIERIRLTFELNVYFKEE